MPFTSDTGRLAGQKSKRGQGLASKELRAKLSLITSVLIDEINIQDLTTAERIALLRVLAAYTIPKPRIEAIEQETQPMYFQVEIIEYSFLVFNRLIL